MVQDATLILPSIGGVRVWLLAFAFADQLTGGVRRMRLSGACSQRLRISDGFGRVLVPIIAEIRLLPGV
jgi:hypothetical protein